MQLSSIIKFKTASFLPIIIITFLTIYLYNIKGQEILPQKTEYCVSDTCHNKITDPKWVHGPVGAMKCNGCHDTSQLSIEITGPHKADLLRKGNELCLFCHTRLKARLEEENFSHKPVKEACTKCHNPHASEYKFHLIEKLSLLCINCHKEIIRMNYDEWHKPIREGKCLECHEVHTSNNQKLLIQSGNKLCYKCHKEVLNK